MVAYACPTADMPPPPWMTIFAHWPPLAIVSGLWAAGGIGPARVAVMDRVTGPKAALLARVTHPHVIGVPRRMEPFWIAMQELAAHPEVAFATSSEIGNWFAAIVPPSPR